MSRAPSRVITWLMANGAKYVPFADAATAELPMSRLLRLGLFQVTVGMAMTLLAGTLNRVMIVELGASAAWVAAMLALPVLVAPFRALIGHRSDHHRSAFGWRRVPYLWQGTMLQFGGLAIMPFALLLLQGSHTGSMVPGRLGCIAAFLLVGLGSHTVQTAGLALATDLAPPAQRPRVVALLYLMLLVGMLASALLIGGALQEFSYTRLVGLVQGAALVTAGLNIVAIWRQEPRNRERAADPPPVVPFREAWRDFMAGGRAGRLLAALGIGTFGFAMQDVLLEPYGGQVLGFGVGATTMLTGLMAAGAILAFTLAARRLEHGSDPARLAAVGMLAGIVGFVAVVMAYPFGSATVLRVGTLCLGFGNGLFAVGTLTSAMALDRAERNGLALGAWGAVSATAAGLAVGLGGSLRDLIGGLAMSGRFGAALVNPAAGYTAVYHLEIACLFVALAAIGPLVATTSRDARPFGLAELPG
ncbi:MAG: BCD family MFS transporter [Gemmatimonadales bacterium]|nr:BCD family MFS transporter [Gemmatimonadales bacterium]